MQIWTPSAYPRAEGEFRVELNPGRKSGEPFATIDLSEDGGTALIMQSVADADRLIKAAVEAKRLLLGEDIPPALEQDLAQADADPANPYGSSTGQPGTGNTTAFEVEGSSKHGRYDASSAAEVAEGVGPTDAGPAATTTDAPATAEPPAGETVEFTTDSRVTLSAPCQQPEAHGFGLNETDWHGGLPVCSDAAHHVAASIPADGAR